MGVGSKIGGGEKGYQSNRGKWISIRGGGA